MNHFFNIHITTHKFTSSCMLKSIYLLTKSTISYIPVYSFFHINIIITRKINVHVVISCKMLRYFMKRFCSFGNLVMLVLKASFYSYFCFLYKFSFFPGTLTNTYIVQTHIYRLDIELIYFECYWGAAALLPDH